ncbi:MAG: hypothetical protein BGN87_15935 [Rhizobiales bacterium 65-79]|jgi:hypothetical protein|nr:MAG: hypothetical protein BGN87_15935 [Rhizobiales bacterium 65-79]
MDWNAAIEKNREALKRVLAMLVAMAGLEGADPRSPSPLWGGAGGTLSRHLHRAVLRLLRPAEAAARRLIIVAARGMIVTLRTVRPGGPRHMAKFAPSPSALRADTSPPEGGEDGSQAEGPSSPPGTGGEVPRTACIAAHPRNPLTMLRRDTGVGEAERGAAKTIARHSDGDNHASILRPSFPLFDPLRRFRRRRPAPRGVPRISFPGFGEPFRIPTPPSPDDAVDARRLAMRLAALARVLDDLPREARRFARWRARVAAGAQIKGGRQDGLVRRVWPLRPGRPPGHPPARGGRPRHEVHDILDVTHGLAFWTLEPSDTS